MTQPAVMETSVRPLTPAQGAELRGYVAWGVSVFRAVVFLAAVLAVAGLLRAAHDRLLPAGVQHDLWWLLPGAAFAFTLYRRARRWTGGRGFRAKVRADLSQGVAAVHRVVAVEALEVEQREDEGPAYFLRLAGGETMVFAGQYLEACMRRGFPWREFEIVEAPSSGVFFGIIPRGEKLTPSGRRPPLTWQEFKQFRLANRNYAIVDVPFVTLIQS